MVFTPLKPDEVSLQNSNELDFYDVSSYHIKLYVAPFLNTNLDNVKPDKKAKIIAESGVTAIGIEDLEFQTFWGYQSKTYTSVATIFKFTLKEPLGASLLDQIKTIADDLGIDNFIKMPFFLEITFRGRNSKDGAPITPSLMPSKIYPIHILKMELNIDKGGTIYTCEAVKVHDYSHTQTYGIFNKEIILEVRDLEDALKQLEDELNKNEAFAKSQTGQGGRSKDSAAREIYHLNINDDIKAKGSFVKDPDKTKSGRGDPYLAWDNKKTTMHITPGSEIGNVIDILMTNTEWLQENITKTKARKAHKILSTVKMTKYDAVRNDYVRDITLDIVPLLIRPLIANASEVEEKSVKEDAIGPFPEGDGVIAKAYHYIFTGKNSHVINFDFKLNLAWYTMLPRLSGIGQGNINDAGLMCYPANDPIQGTWHGWIDSLTDGVDVNTKSVTPLVVDDPTNLKPSYPERAEGSTSGVYKPSFQEGPIDQESSSTLESTQDTKASFTAALLRNYIEDSRAEFIVADVEIRGDPFWLTATNTELIYFIFTTGLPQEVDMQTGIIPPPADTFITGLFQILSVKHSFSKGQFTQTLTGRRDPLTKITRTAEKDAEKPLIELPLWLQ